MKNRPHILVNDTPASADTGATPRRRTLARRAPAPMALEPRVMFDGAAPDAVLAAAAGAAGADAVARDTSAQRSGEASDKYVPAAVQAPAPAAARHEIVFIGDNIANHAQLVAGVRAGVEVIMLDHTRDGMQQIIDALNGREPVDAVHLVTHGAGGMIDFGSERISTANLALYGDKLARIGQALGADADLLIYGCDVAQGAHGATLIDQLAQLTGADVAASTNITGSAAFGGDFVLEASSGALETKALALDSAGWDGRMAVSIYNANWQTLNFDGTKIEAVKTGSNGTKDGDIVRFKNVITIDGVSIDAVVTTRLDRTTITAFDSLTQPTPPVPEYFQPNLDVIDAGGGATFVVDFQVNGQSVTLQNVVVNSYDIDAYGSSAPDRQYQEFRGFAKYQVGKSTKLVASAKSDGSVTFQYTSATGVNSTDLKADDYRVKVFYDSISSFQIKSGVNATGSGTFQGVAYFALDFSQGPGWVNGFNEVETPAASLSYSASNFTEAAANDGSITMTSTITLKSNSFTGVFSGSNNSVLSGVTFSNVPAGLTAEVVRASDTTAILRLTGKATAHGSANSVDNLRVSFSDAAFTGDADAIPNATRSDIKVTFIDPPADTTAPIVSEGQTIIYAENRPANTVIGTVAATDNVAVTGFRFADTSSATSNGGHFTIDSSGHITMTAIGAASVLNDAESVSSVTYLIQARDAAGNWSASREITLALSDVDDSAPIFSSGTSAKVAENQSQLYVAQAHDVIEFTDELVTYSLKSGVGDVNALSIDPTTGVVTLKNGNLDFEGKSSYTFTVIAKDATGNASERAVTIAVADADEVPPTVVIESSHSSLKAGETATLTFTFSEPVGSSFTLADISVESGSIGNLVSIGGNRYTASYTPAPSTLDGAVSISVAVGKFTDLAANANTAPASISLAVDTQRPLVTGPGDATGPTSTKSIPENSTAVHQFTASETVSWTLSGEDAAKFQIDANGNLSFRTAPDYEAPSDTATSGANTYLVNVIARDINGNDTTQALQLTVTNVNELPQAADASISTSEDMPVTGSLPAASDVDGDNVGYAAAAAPTHGTVTIQADGTYTYAPDLNYHGADSFSYTVSDGKGGSNTHTVNVTVTPVDDAPALSVAPVEVGQGQEVTIGSAFLNAQDIDTGAVKLVFTVTSAPGKGQLMIDNAVVTSFTQQDILDKKLVYKADVSGSEQLDAFTVTVSDGTSTTVAKTVDITIRASNIAPTSGDRAVTTPEDTAYVFKSGDFAFADANPADTLDKVEVFAPSTGKLQFKGGDGSWTDVGASLLVTAGDIAAGKLQFVPALDANGSPYAGFNYKVLDPAGAASGIARMTVNVTPVNDVPLASGATLTTSEDTPAAGKLPAATDADQDAVSYAGASNPSHGTVEIKADGSYTYTPVANYHGADSFGYTVSDGKGGSNTYTVNVTVTPVNDAPVGSGTAIATSENTPASGKLPAASDADQDAVSYAAAGNPSHGTVEVKADGSYAYTPASGYNGADSFSYTISDGKGGSNTYTVSVTVGPVNDAPVASDTAIATSEDTPASGKLPAATDPDQDPVSYARASNPSHGTVEIKADGSYTYTPVANYSGADSFSYTVSDGNGGSNTYTVSITVSPVNDAPVASGTAIATTENTPASGKLPAASDADQDAVSYAAAGNPSHGTVEIKADGSYTYTPTPGYNGADSFSYTVSDGKGGSNTYTVSVTVGAVNDAPVGSGAAIATSEDTPATGKLPSATDADQDAVGYAKASNPSHGTVEIKADGSYTYIPAANYNGADSFSYTVTDGKGGSNTYTVNVTVTPVNDAPVAANAALSTLEDTPVSGSLPRALDADGDAVTYAGASAPAHGTVSILADGSYRYTPEANYHGADRFTYTVSDGKGGSNTYAVDVTVGPVNDAPQAQGGASGTGMLGEPMTPIQVPAFTDIDSPVLTYTATLADGSPLPAWLVFDPATLSFGGTPAAGSVGSYTVTLSASDGALSASASVSITVANPPAPSQSLGISSMTRDTGVSASDFITADGGANRIVTGSLSAPLGRNEIVRVSYDGGASWTTATVNGTSWSAVDSGAHGANWTIEARVTNTLSGLSGAGTVQSVTLDTSVPSAPSVDTIETSSPTPVITGAAVLAPGEKLQVSIGSATYDVTPQNGSWALDLSTATPVSGTPARLEPGLSYDVVAAVTDLSGNVARDATSGDVRVAVPVVPREVLLPPAPVVAPEAATPAAPPLPEVAAAPEVAAPAAPPVLAADPVAPGSVVGNDTLTIGSAFGGGRASEDSFALQLQRAAELSDVYTRSDGFRTVVAPAEEPALVLFQGVPDQYIETGARLSVTVPSDAFAHTQPKAVVRLAATMQDGSALPGWVQFNGQTGQFSGQVPEGMKGELRIKLTARDQAGREATALFRLNVGQAKGVGGKAGLTDLLRQTGKADTRQAQLASIARPGK